MFGLRAELGQTTDPKALVPGDPAAVLGTARTMTRFGDALVMAGDGLRRIDDGGWTGAAADAFHDAFDTEPGRWIRCGDAFHKAAGALTSYSSTLEWAQGQAREAIVLWHQGDVATEAARRDHDKQIGEAVSDGDLARAAGLAFSFHDPGAAKRDRAREILTRARTQLDAAGDEAERLVGEARDEAPPKPKWYEHVGEFLGDVGDGLVAGGKHVLNRVASVGNAMLHHPGDTALTVAGAALMGISAAGEGGGLALSATGVGAVGGVPLTAVSAAGMAAGAGMAGVGLANIARHAASDDQVSPMKTEGGGGSGGASTPGNAPKNISGRTNHGNQQALGRDGHGVSDKAMNDAVENPISPPEAQPGGTFKYVGENATVVLNSEGKVVTTWARNSAGWRTP